VFDSSKSNIFVLTLNIIKAAAMLIEVIEKVKGKFSFLNRRVNEIRQRIVKMAVEYTAGVQTEEEMRFYLLEKDLDNRDALDIVYSYGITELIDHPFAQNIVHEIWASPYNNSHSLFTVSSTHTLLFNYNHCRYDEESRLRNVRNRDLDRYGCHGYQF